MIPGINLLKVAQTIIAKQSFVYYEFAGRVKNSIGKYENSFNAGVEVRDTIQPIPQPLIRELGLSLERTYIMVYTSVDVGTVARGASPDIIDFSSRRYQALESNDWIAIDGWEGLMFIDIGAVSDPFPGVIV